MERSYQPFGIGVGTLINNRYELLQKLGAGANSAVYKVYDRALNNDTIALKLFSPGVLTNDTAVERIRNEALISRKLTHPNIVRTYDIGRTNDGHLFLTMEFVEGTSLDRIIHGPELHRPTFVRTVEILCEIAAGLEYAHRESVIHRDMKPANILVGTDGRIKLADFGLARALYIKQDLTQAGETVGTPYYMAPEQIRDEALDGRTDIYALGIIAYELVMGRVPFQESNWFKLAEIILKQPLPDCSRLVRVPEWFHVFLSRATAKDPNDRYPSSDAVRQLLEEKLTAGDLSESTSADRMLPKLFTMTGLKRIPGAETRAEQLLRRGPAKFSNTALLTVALILVVLVGGASVLTAKQEEMTQQMNAGTEFMQAAGSFLNQMRQGAQLAREHREEIQALFHGISSVIQQSEQLRALQGTPESVQGGTQPVSTGLLGSLPPPERLAEQLQVLQAITTMGLRASQGSAGAQNPELDRNLREYLQIVEGAIKGDNPNRGAPDTTQKDLSKQLAEVLELQRELKALIDQQGKLAKEQLRSVNAKRDVPDSGVIQDKESGK